nr:pyruvate dehydrogenase phosphatase regulatory subunit, mitochondrial-like [Kogia breviceps]
MIEPLLSSLLRRMPELETLEIMKLVNCPETFTLDMRCIMGESPSVRGYFVLAGMNSAGLSFGGGAGRGHRFEPWSGKIPHAAEQLSPCATSTEPALWSL